MVVAFCWNVISENLIQLGWVQQNNKDAATSSKFAIGFDIIVANKLYLVLHGLDVLYRRSLQMKCYA